jgi:hypothetical protein
MDNQLKAARTMCEPESARAHLEGLLKESEDA